MNSLLEADKEEYLRVHLAKHYGVRIVALQRLGKGVFSITLDDSRRWIARVFPVGRSVEHVEADASILQFLEKQGFPAERCATDSPVSVLRGRGILVIEYIEGTSAGSSERMLNALGKMLARLNMLPAENSAQLKSIGLTSLKLRLRVKLLIHIEDR